VIRGLLQEENRVLHRLKIVSLAFCVASREVEAVIEMIDDDHSSRTEQPCTSCRHDANGTGSEYNDGITSLDSSHLRCLVTCGNHIGQQDCIFNVHAFRDDCGSNVRIRYAHIFGLTTIITARRMRVTEDSTY